MTIETTVIFDRADALLSSIVDGYSGTSVSPPDVQFVTQGDVPHDCEALAVSVVGVFAGLPHLDQSLEPIRCYLVRTVELSVNLIRCWPTMNDQGTPPSADAINTAAEALMEEAWIVGNSILTHFKSNTLYGELEVTLGPLVPQTPDGGFTAWTQTIRVEII